MSEDFDFGESLVAGGVQKRTNPNEYPEIEEDFNLENFEKYIFHSQENWKELSQQIIATELNNLSIRFSVWRLLLRTIPLGADDKQLVEIITEQRKFYNDNLEKFKPKTDPNLTDDKTAVKKAPFNPLAPKPKANSGKNGPMSGFFDDQELKTDIKKDVERTYQDKQFFLNLKIKGLLTNILFVWAKLNPAISYRQGMNEIVASLIVIYFTESIYVLKHKSEFPETPAAALANFMMDIDQAEADIFTLFYRIMEIGHAKMFVHDTKKKNLQPILQRVARIQDHYLKVIDIDLFRHFKLLNVEFQIFLLRWIRCVFTREFHMNDSFSLWDNIFLDFYKSSKKEEQSGKPGEEDKEEEEGNEKMINLKNFFLIDAISLAMIIYVREDVIEKEEGHECLQRYLKYPPVGSIPDLIQTAFKVKKQLIENYDNTGSPDKYANHSTPLPGFQNMGKSANNNHNNNNNAARDKGNPLLQSKNSNNPLAKSQNSHQQQQQQQQQQHAPLLRVSPHQEEFKTTSKESIKQAQTNTVTLKQEPKKVLLGDTSSSNNNNTTGSAKKNDFGQQEEFRCQVCNMFTGNRSQFILHCSSKHQQEIIDSCSQRNQTKDLSLESQLKEKEQRILILEQQLQMMINSKKEESKERSLFDESDV